MRQLLLLLVLISLSVSSNNVFAAEEEDSIEINVQKQHGHRPRKPQKHGKVEGYYQDNILQIEFLSPEGDVTVTLINDGEIVYEMEDLDSSDLIIIPIIEETGQYKIEITTSVGKRYIGYLNF